MTAHKQYRWKSILDPRRAVPGWDQQILMVHSDWRRWLQVSEGFARKSVCHSLLLSAKEACDHQDPMSACKNQPLSLSIAIESLWPLLAWLHDAQVPSHSLFLDLWILLVQGFVVLFKDFARTRLGLF